MNNAMVFYFSASGNTLYLCNAIREGLNRQGIKTELIDISALPDKPVSPEKYDLIGFAFPVFVWDAPLNMLDFIKHLPKVNNKPCFIFVTCGGIRGNVLFKSARRLKRKGYNTVWAKTLRCEDSHPVLRRWWTKIFISQGRPDKKHYTRLKLQASSIPQNYTCITVPNPLAFPLDLISPLYNATIRFWMKKWVLHDKCIKCGDCVNYCPTKTLDFNDDGFPFVKSPKKCIACYRCVNICPTKAFCSVFTKRGIAYKRLMPLIKQGGINGKEKSAEFRRTKK